MGIRPGDATLLALVEEEGTCDCSKGMISNKYGILIRDKLLLTSILIDPGCFERASS